MPDLLVAGSSNTDLVCRAARLPRPGETVRGQSFQVFAGGKSANQAVAAARAGATVAFAGTIGNDDYGTARLADLRDEGIDVSRVQVVDGAQSGIALIAVDDQGGNQIIYVSGANDLLTADQVVGAIESLEPSTVLLNLEAPFQAVTAALEAAHPEQRMIVNCAPFDERIRDVLPRIDVLICNEIEAGELLGRAVTTASALDDAHGLLRLGAKAVVITLGAGGAVIASDQATLHVPALTVDVVDTTGCGDAFCGVMAAWLAAGSGVDEAIRAGVVAGSLAATQHGAQASLPVRDQILIHM